MRTIAGVLLPLPLRSKRQKNATRLDRTTVDPARYQQETLLRILSLNAETTYGREHRFGKIRSAAEFGRAVPINTYEELRPYVDRVADGSDPHALTSDPVEMFTNTSGTTAKPKLIPVTASGRAAERRVKNAWIAHLATDHPSVLRGKWFYLFNNAEEYRTPAGLWVGSNAGLMYRNTNPVVRSLQAVPYEVCLVDDYESRYYVILRHLLASDLTFLTCINPSSILLLAELVNQNAESLIRDIYCGGLRDGLELSAEQYAFFRPRLPAKRERSRALARMLSKDDRLLPSRYWPNLSVLCSWKGPGVNTFIEKCRPWFGDLPFRDVGYGSSEFRSGLVISDDGSPNIPLPDNYFYEFIPADDPAPYVTGDRPALGLHELEKGSRYIIIQTGPHGLYRYNIEDIVEVNGHHGRTPTIHFVQKSRMVTSITGEKLYETQVIEAVERASAKRPELKPSFFICYADIDASNYKLCVEYDEPPSPEALRELLALFEEALGEVNIEYPYKRASMRLRDPEIFPLPRGSSLKLIQHIGKRAAMDNQAKIPRLSRDVEEHFAVFGLEPRRAHAG
jgi:hypothetical protein